MRKLLIHIGYPKTATTTLQQSLFKLLHSKGEINYYDRFKIRDEIFYNGLGRGIFISPKVINVLSDEFFTVPGVFIEKKYAKQIDSFEFPKRIFDYFADKVDEMEILVSLRNQPDLIFSFYVQGYRYFINEPLMNSFDKYLAYGIENRDIFANYNFHDLLLQYKEIFGEERINIIIFEDLLAKNYRYYEDLAKLLYVNESLVKSIMNKAHMNKKNKTEDGSISLDNINRQTLEGILKKIRFNSFIMKSYYRFEEKYGENNIFQKLIRLSQDKVQIPKMTEVQKKLIYDLFKESNKKLLLEFNLNRDALQKYGYI